MSTLSSVNVTDVNLVLKERTCMRLCLNMLIFTHNLGNWTMLEAYRKRHPKPKTIVKLKETQQMIRASLARGPSDKSVKKFPK